MEFAMLNVNYVYGLLFCLECLIELVMTEEK